MEARVDQTSITAHGLKQLYAEYRHTTDLEAKASFFSPDCRQICRPKPAFAAQGRDTIMMYLRETAGKNTEDVQQFLEDSHLDRRHATATGPATRGSQASVSADKKSYYTIRPLVEGEMGFGNDEAAAPAGYKSAAQIASQAESEGWLGMRVDLWDDEGTDRDGVKKHGMLAKVQYWWRRGDGGAWSQILHDILYLGSRDGTEGSQGEILE